MTITYEYNGALYLNITNLCSNSCDFCIRNHGRDERGGATVYTENSLWLEREPTRDEIWNAISRLNLDTYTEVIFCGYGEPTCRLYDLLWLCRKIRAVSPHTPIRINTNGQASLIAGEDTAVLFDGLVDVMSISLNAADSDTYEKICHPRFGAQIYEAILKFARDTAKHVPKVVLTVVEGTMPDRDVEKCRLMAAELGVGFRVREMI